MADETHTAQEAVAQPWYRLGNLPSTNWKVIIGSAVTLVTMVQYFALQWSTVTKSDGTISTRDTMVSAAMWDSWLLFVATAVLTVPAAQYVAKRLTFKAGGPDDMRAKLDNAAAAQDAATETGQPPLAPTPPARLVAVHVPEAPPRRAVPASDAPGQLVDGVGD